MMKREMNSFSLFHYIYKNVIIYIDYFSLRSIMELLWRKRIMYKTESFKPDTFKPARFESDGKITLSGKEIPYHTICEDNVIYGPDGNPVASIFTYAYFRSDVEDTSNRPVVFAYNGGPGSSCMYVHAGFLGTRRMQYDEVDRESAFGPYKVIDNPDCLIDIADIVLIDPVGTGYGVLIDESKKTYCKAFLTFGMFLEYTNHSLWKSHIQQPYILEKEIHQFFLHNADVELNLK